MKIIAGIEAPDDGKIAKNKTATLGYLAQDTGLDSNETVWNEMLKAFEQVRQMEQRMRELEIFISEGTPDTPAYTSYLKDMIGCNTYFFGSKPSGFSARYFFTPSLYAIRSSVAKFTLQIPRRMDSRTASSGTPEAP